MCKKTNVIAFRFDCCFLGARIAKPSGISMLKVDWRFRYKLKQIYLKAYLIIPLFGTVWIHICLLSNEVYVEVE